MYPFADSILPLIQHGKKRLLLGALVGMIGGYLIALLLTPLYEAKTVFYPVNLGMHPEKSTVEEALEVLQNPDIHYAVIRKLALDSHYGFIGDIERSYALLRRRVKIYRSRFSSIHLEVKDQDSGMARRIVAEIMDTYESHLQQMHRQYWTPILDHRIRYVDSIRQVLAVAGQSLRQALLEGHMLLAGEANDVSFETLAEQSVQLATKQRYYGSLVRSFRRHHRLLPDSLVINWEASQWLYSEHRRWIDSLMTQYPRIAAQYAHYQALLASYQAAVEDLEKAREQAMRHYSYAVSIQKVHVSSEPVFPCRRWMALWGMMVGVLGVWFREIIRHRNNMKK